MPPRRDKERLQRQRVPGLAIRTTTSLARVVHSLWASRGEAEPQALIGPGDVDLADESVREGFLEQAGEVGQYRSVIEADFLAGDAGTKRIDERIGGDALALARLRVGTRVATAIMLLSFGGQREDQRGALEREVNEATLIPRSLARRSKHT